MKRSTIFFDCVVAKKIWSDISEFFSIDLGENYLSIARFWPANKKHTAMNAFVACVLWSIWKTRNNHVFNNAVWSDLKQIWWLVWRTLKRWMILYKGKTLEKL